MAKLGRPKGIPSSAPTIPLGTRFGRWQVLRLSDVRYARQRQYVCRCDCGTERVVLGASLTHGKSAGCGCERRERSHGPLIHGHAVGGRPTRTYRSWCAMLGRCHRPTDPAWRYYGGRGITVCEEWRESFQNFLRDMGERPAGRTLDRIDNDGGYCKANCRWATPKEQAANKRKKGTA